MFEYRCTVLRVVDADTLHVEVDLGLDLRTRLTIRLDGVDAPEMSTPEGVAARDFVLGWVAEPGPLTLRTTKDRREKYGRYLGVVHGQYGPSLNAVLVTAGHAKPYTGGRR